MIRIEEIIFVGIGATMTGTIILLDVLGWLPKFGMVGGC